MTNVADFIGCCGAQIAYNIVKQYRKVNGENILDYPTSMPNPGKGLVLAILNESQIQNGAEDFLLKNGYKILIDGWRNINMGNSYCTLYAKIEDPSGIRSRFDEKSPDWKKKLKKTRDIFFRHTVPK